MGELFSDHDIQGDGHMQGRYTLVWLYTDWIVRVSLLTLFVTVSKASICLICIQIQNSLVSLMYYFQQFITQSNGFPLEAEQRALAGRVLSHISVHHFSALFNRIAIRWIQIIILWFLVNCAFFFAFEKKR